MVGLLYRQIIRRSLNSLASPSRAAESTQPNPTLLPTKVHYTPASEANIKRGIEFFDLKNLYTLGDMMEARIHFGHKERMLNEHMRPYIFGKRLGVLVIDLEQTDQLLQQALVVTAEIAYREGIILFFHDSRQNGHLVEAAAKQCGEYAYCRRWNPDVLTNSRGVFGAVTRLPDLILTFNNLQGVINIAAKMMIPTIGICDTNADPTLVTYPVPGNDDSPQSIEFLSRLFATAILKGKAKRKETPKSSD